MLSTNYDDFLATKHVRVDHYGFDADESALNPFLFDWQRAVVRWWLKLGRAGGFEDCGLGKTLQELAWAEAIIRGGHGKRALILAPPAVGQQTKREAEKFGIGVDVRVCRRQTEVMSGITITNYERLHLFDTAAFDAVVLDESSILKSYMGKTKQALLAAFKNTRYRLAATATPAPNDHLELGNHGDFLGVMRANEMLARWFINDAAQAGNYRLKKHAEDDYWKWVASWAVSVSKPSDLGDYSDEGFCLPPLDLVEHVLGDQGFLEESATRKFSATGMHEEKRRAANERAEYATELVRREPNEPWVIWCETNYEADALRAAMPDAFEVRGSQSIDEKESLLNAFTKGEIQKLITKADIAGFGLNWQHCANTIVAGHGYSYEKFYQLIRRFYRFGQQRSVHCYLILTAAERAIAETLHEKSEKHELMKSKMCEHMQVWQQANLRGELPLSKPPKPVRYAEGDRESGLGNREESAGEARPSDLQPPAYSLKPELPEWQLWHGDCVEVARGMEADSIDFCIHSPPFSNLYIYSDSTADMGNAKDHAEFFAHYEFLIKELYRVTVPGRLCAVHCKDLPLYKGRDGAAGLYDFPAQITGAFERHGWVFHSRVTIWKDPVTEMQRTKNHGLLHRQLCKDSSYSRQGMADYLLVFRKWNDDGAFSRPVTLGTPYCRFTGYVGEYGPPDSYQPLPVEQLSTLEKADPYSIAVWQRYASPVWFDINQMRVLNYRLGRDDKDEKHICPLQLDVIERAVELWTNPGDVVYDPFNGIGSSGYVALRSGRCYVGSELKDSYVRESLKNFERAIEERERAKVDPQPTLFDLDSEPSYEEVTAA
jgi:DNA modification methylase/superfamily II DNA or RNA helicase